jgi:hypothetical protein
MERFRGPTPFMLFSIVDREYPHRFAGSQQNKAKPPWLKIELNITSILNQGNVWPRRKHQSPFLDPWS